MAADAIQGCNCRPNGMNTPTIHIIHCHDRMQIHKSHKITELDDLEPHLSISNSENEIPLTCRERYSNQIIDCGSYEVDPNSLHRLLGQENGRHHVQQVVLQ